jgi:hypothetical protein
MRCRWRDGKVKDLGIVRGTEKEIKRNEIRKFIFKICLSAHRPNVLLSMSDKK